MPRTPSRPPLDLSGKWVVEDLPARADSAEYLGLTPNPHVLITHTEFWYFMATFQFGTQRGEIHGRVDEVWTTAAQLFLTFVGHDGDAEMSGGVPDGAWNASDDTITGTMRYHKGDDVPFVWKRSKAPTKPPAARGRPRKS